MNAFQRIVGKRPFAYKVIVTIASIVVGVVLDVTNVVESPSQALLVTVILILLGLLFEAEAREDAHFHELIAVLSTNHDSLSRGTLSRIEWETYFKDHIQLKAPAIRDTLMASARDSLVASQIAEERFPEGLIPDRIEARWQAMRREASNLSAGRIEDHGHEYLSTMERATERAKRLIQGVTTITSLEDSRLWWTTTGRSYLSANHAALERGVNIFRIVLVPVDLQVSDATLMDIFNAPSVRPSKMRIGLVTLDHRISVESRNVVIWDEQSAWCASMDTRGAISGGVYSEDPMRVREERRYFHRLFGLLPVSQQRDWLDAGLNLGDSPEV